MQHTTGKASPHVGYLCALDPIILRSVVLPLPLGPIKARTSFGRQQPVMLNRICKSSIHVIMAAHELMICQGKISDGCLLNVGTKADLANAQNGAGS